MSGSDSLAARSLVVDVLGLHGRQADGWTSVRTVVTLLDDLGVPSTATRSGLGRLRRRAWLAPETRDGMAGDRLTDTALAEYARLDPFVLHGPQVAPSDTEWVVVSVSVPETQRAVRHQLRSRLAARGFGNTNPGVWMAPVARADTAVSIVDELGLSSSADIVVGHPARPERLGHAIARGWQLDDLAAGYRRLVAEHQVGPALTGREAFVRRATLIHQWRPLVVADPALPATLMPADWPASAAAAVVRRAEEQWAEAANAYVRSLQPSPPHRPASESRTV